MPRPQATLPAAEPDPDADLCDRCGGVNTIDRHGDCRSPECESARIEAAESLLEDR